MKAKRANFIIGVFAIGLISIVTAYYRSFSGQNLSSYDDAGMPMIDLQRFFEGRVLYDGLSTIYGPFYFLYEWCTHVLTGTPVSHDSVRFVSMFFWVACALLVFLFVYRATNSLVIGGLGALLVICHPWLHRHGAGASSGALYRPARGSGPGCLHHHKPDRSTSSIDSQPICGPTHLLTRFANLCVLSRRSGERLFWP